MYSFQNVVDLDQRWLPKS